MLTFGSLFAGVGGFDIGLERAGFTCKWQVELDEYAMRILKRRWPHVRRHDDIRTFLEDGDTEGWQVDAICGGFPCTNISSSGDKTGIEGKASGLWFYFSRVIRILRPAIVIVENVAAIASRGLDRVLGDLAALGFDAEWACLPAAAFGSPQRRWRMFVVAYPHGWGQQGGEKRHSVFPFSEGWDYRDGLGLAESRAATAAARVRRMDGRVPRGVDRDRIRCCGNAVVPVVAEWIGRRILEAAEE